MSYPAFANLFLEESFCLQLGFTDEEGDRIWITNDHELETAIRIAHCNGQLFRVSIPSYDEQIPRSLAIVATSHDVACSRPRPPPPSIGRASQLLNEIKAFKSGRKFGKTKKKQKQKKKTKTVRLVDEIRAFKFSKKKKKKTKKKKKSKLSLNDEIKAFTFRQSKKKNKRGKKAVKRWNKYKRVAKKAAAKAKATFLV